jgi:hypothetical protein
VLIPEVNRRAAAAAIVALEILLICIVGSSIVIERSGIAAHVKDPANTGIITQLSKLMRNVGYGFVPRLRMLPCIN